MDKLFVNFLPPWVETNIQPAFYDKESGSVLQQTARMYAKVNCLVRMFNKLSKETKETVDEYIAKFVELKDFVDTYFENLDVQEEINNKLDAMVADGSLEEILESYFNNEIKFIFPQNWTNNINGSGDISLIKAYGKNILMDASVSSYETQVNAFLDSNDAQSLDYVVISHYDGDHMGCIAELITNGYINENTHVYLPAPPSELGIGSTTNEYAVKNALDANNIPYSQPEEGDTLVIEDMTMHFYNNDVDTLVASGWSDYNNYSMIAYIEHLNHHIIYPGDCFEYPLSRLIDKGWVKNTIDLYVVEHHGINYISYNQPDHTPLKFLDHTQPRYSFVPANTVLLHQNNISTNLTTSYLKEIGCKMYGQYISTIQTVFVSNVFNFENVSGTPIKSLSNAYSEPIIYVDASSVVEMPDGSQNKPFRDLPQAIGYCNGLTQNAVIRLADGNYGVLHPDTAKKNISHLKGLRIRIEGNENDNTAVVIKEGLVAYDSSIEVKNVTFECNYRDGIRIFGGNLNCYNCNFTTDQNVVVSNQSNGIFSNTSYVTVNKCNFERLNNGLAPHNDVVHLFESTFDDINIPIRLSTSSIDINKITVGTVNNDDNKWITKTGYCCVNCVYETVWTGSTKTETVSLSKDLAHYDEIEVYVGFSSDPDSWNSVTIHAYPGVGFVKNYNYSAPISKGKLNLKFDANDTDKLTITSDDWVRIIRAKITDAMAG